MSALDQLLRRRDAVADWPQRERRRSEQRGVRPDAAPSVRTSVGRLLATLEEELADLERAIAEQVQRHARLRAVRQRLRSVPGVGVRVRVRVVLPLLVACERSHALAGEPGTAKGTAKGMPRAPPRVCQGYGGLRRLGAPAT